MALGERAARGRLGTKAGKARRVGWSQGQARRQGWLRAVGWVGVRVTVGADGGVARCSFPMRSCRWPETLAGGR